MQQELPGFYYDAEKNRYFPIKSPIPGAPSSSASTSAAQKPTPVPKKAKYGESEKAAKVVKMLHVRELCGNSISSNKKVVNFEDQYQKIRASKPIVWKYEMTEGDTGAALEHVYVNIQTRDGLAESELLLSGGLDKMFHCFEVGSVERDGINGWKRVPDLLQPLEIEKQTASLKSPGPVWGPVSARVYHIGPEISCIKIPRNYYPQATNADSSVSHALLTTLKSVYFINLSEPLDRCPVFGLLGRRIDEIYAFRSTIWTADGYSDGSLAVVGTNIGAALVDIETRRMSWICRSKSDVLSLQFDCSGKLVLCGLRNGAIVTVDTRQKPEDLHNALPHHIPFPSLKTGKSNSASGQNCDKQWFEFRGNVQHSRMIFMPSSVSCLVALKLYDQYFLASSMDGTMRLYDHRLTQRGAVQSYEGNVNSHTRIQMAADPSERFLMSGGEDFYMRMWSIKSGEMLYEDKFMDSVPSVVCWTTGGRDCNRRPRNHFPGAWLGSQEGLFYVNIS